MKKTIVITLLLCGVCSVFSQTDSLFLKNYEQKILENNKLKSDLQTDKKKFTDLNDVYKKDTLALQKQIKALQKDIEIEKQKVSDLSKNKVKTERDNFLHKIDSLNTVISTLNQVISDKDKKIGTIRQQGDQKAHEENERGKQEVLVSLLNSYIGKSFDDLIKFSNKESVIRDIQFVDKNVEVKTILNDLLIYFNAEELLNKKFDAIQIKNAQVLLSQIKRESKLLDALKENVTYYQDFNTAFKETIGKLINLDKRKSADGDSEIQKLKFNEIVTELTDYMYNYYDYAKYPYLSDIMLEIIKRKRQKADMNILDLLSKL